MIHLLNRRFVPFYYNTGGPGLGKDNAAAEFVKGKVDNKWAFFAAFDPAGDAIGVTDIYAGKDGVFEFLVNLLKSYPECDKLTKDEEALLKAADDNPDDGTKQIAAGTVLEELGRYEQARLIFRRVLDRATSSHVPQEPLASAWRAMLRMDRYDQNWKQLDDMLAKAADANQRYKLSLDADIAMERGYMLRARKQYAELRTLLEETIRKHPNSKRMGELRFYAGVACFFLSDKDWAWYHWCWVVENIPEDHMNRRCAIAAAHEGMPYANPELDGFQSPEKFGNIERIQAAYDSGKEAYDSLLSAAKARGL